MEFVPRNILSYGITRRIMYSSYNKSHMQFEGAIEVAGALMLNNFEDWRIRFSGVVVYRDLYNFERTGDALCLFYYI